MFGYEYISPNASAARDDRKPMSIKYAVELVSKAAASHANGSGEAVKIIEAIELLKTYVREQED